MVDLGMFSAEHELPALFVLITFLPLVDLLQQLLLDGVTSPSAFLFLSWYGLILHSSLPSLLFKKLLKISAELKMRINLTVAGHQQNDNASDKVENHEN